MVAPRVASALPELMFSYISVFAAKGAEVISRTGVVLTCVVSILLTACGNDDVADTIAFQPQATASAASDATSETSSVAIETTTTSTPLAGQDDLERMSLQLADMPTGWSENAPEDDDDDSLGFCATDTDQLLDTDSWPRLAKQFSAGALGPFLAHSLLAAPDDASAKDFMDQFARLAEQCQTWTNEDASYSLSPVNYPQVGDETFAVRLTVESGGFSYVSDVIVIREASVLSMLLPVALGEPIDSATVVAWMELVETRD